MAGSQHSKGGPIWGGSIFLMFSFLNYAESLVGSFPPPLFSSTVFSHEMAVLFEVGYQGLGCLSVIPQYSGAASEGLERILRPSEIQFKNH